MAAQDQSLSTRNYQANILKTGVDDKCRFCDKFTETIDHLISSCSILAPTECKNRHKISQCRQHRKATATAGKVEPISTFLGQLQQSRSHWEICFH